MTEEVHTKMKKPPKVGSGIGAKLRELVLDQHTAITAAKALGVQPQHLYELFSERINLSSAVAARLHRIGIDGRALYLEQSSNRLAYFERKEAAIQDTNKRLGLTG